MEEHLEIDAKAMERAKRFRVCEAEILESVLEVDGVRVWETMGYASLWDYCTKRLALSESYTSAFICIARKSKTVPALKEAVTSGTLSASQAKRIVSVIEPENASEW